MKHTQKSKQNKSHLQKHLRLTEKPTSSFLSTFLFFPLLSNTLPKTLKPTKTQKKISYETLFQNQKKRKASQNSLQQPKIQKKIPFWRYYSLAFIAFNINRNQWPRFTFLVWMVEIFPTHSLCASLSLPEIVRITIFLCTCVHEWVQGWTCAISAWF